MHELSLCRAIAGIVTKHADSRPVTTVHIRVGQLRQIVPDTLVYCWTLVRESSGLGGAELRVESVPAQIRCEACEHVETLTAPVMICPGCDSRRVSVIAGEEFLITSLDLAEA